MANVPNNHPRRAKPDLPGTPTPEQIKAAREAAGLSVDQAAELVMHTWHQWTEWEEGLRRMHPIVWWASQQRAGSGDTARRIARVVAETLEGAIRFDDVMVDDLTDIIKDAMRNPQ